MKSLVIGKGQIGQALFEIFSNAHECYIRDILLEQDDPGQADILHVAYPFGENFVENTKHYIAYYRPILTIIHSSVAIGTTDLCGEHVVHSPERGRFPNLAKEMLKFPKFVGGGVIQDRNIAKSYLDDAGWNTVLIDDARWTELVKLLSNIHLGLEIAWRQEVDRISEALIGEPAGPAYTLWETTYNQGHSDLGHRQLIRPIVRPAPIGGHCILPCTDMLGGQFDSKLFHFIKESNAKRKTEETSYADCAVSNR